MIISNLMIAIIHLVFAMLFLLLPLINYSLFRMKNEKNIFEDIDIELENKQNEKPSLVVGTQIFQI